MNRNTLFVLLLGLLIAAGLAYGLMNRPAANDEDSVLNQSEEEQALELRLARLDLLIDEELDVASLRGRLLQAGAPIDVLKAEVVLPLLREHLSSLRTNLKEARAAKTAGLPLNEQRRHYIFAAQAHGKFQAAIQGVVAPEVAIALFNAYPAMLPPSPTPLRAPASTKAPAVSSESVPAAMETSK